MPHRYHQKKISFLPHIRLRVGAAIREKWREGYGPGDLKADCMSGLVVGMVAIPLAMALAIASGVAPHFGLYTVIVAGTLVALLGGSRFQVSGPTAAFVVVLLPVVNRFGFSGLLMAGLLAGFLLLFMGLLRLGRLIQFIPYPVTTGFTSGIAVVIATIQVKDLFGLQLSHAPEGYFGRIAALYQARGTASLIELSIGLVTLALLIFWPKINKKIPAPLVVLTGVTAAAVALKSFFPDMVIATIGNRFSTDIGGVQVPGIPGLPPAFAWPWSHVSSGNFALNFATLESLMPSAFAIAILGAIESLLSAVVADGMAQTRHDPDAELVALGIGNILCPFFGGIPATGAIARTATNIRFGARSPLSAVIHALFCLLAVLFLAPIVSLLPMAALAGLLILVAYDMSEWKHFLHILKVAPRSDAGVLLLCFALTVLFDMVVGVTVGVVLASMLFMNRMAAITTGQKLIGSHRLRSTTPLPSDVHLYEISGPFFFGAAESAISAIHATNETYRAMIFLMESVPAMDMTGLVAFESAVRKLRKSGTQVIVVGLKKQPALLLSRSELVTQKQIELCDSIDHAVNHLSKAS